MTNQARRTRAQYALMQYQGTTARKITDLITDLLHYAHAQDINPDWALKTAKGDYLVGVNDNDDD